MTVDLTADHHVLSDTQAARRYFSKFDRITGHMARVAAAMHRENRLTKADVDVVGTHVARLTATFEALSYKYLMTGHVSGVASAALTIDRVESGFPVYAELLHMASDAQQAAKHLAGMPDEATLKDQMIHQIIGQGKNPVSLQYALSQRLYYMAMETAPLFWARNDPMAIWQGNPVPERKHYLLHWSVYDSQQNVPVIYLMDVEDSGATALPRDQHRWPEVQAHLMAQSVSALKLVTVATGFDRDFDDLHPKRLRRIVLGPMYSSAFTLQTGPIRQVLENARGGPGEDWTMAWTIETLLSERTTRERSGWLGTVEREIFALDPFAGRGADTGATRTDRALILPEHAWTALAELRPQGLDRIHKFVVGRSGRVLSYA